MYIVTNSSKHDITAAAITFAPGESKPMPLSPAKFAQINHRPELAIQKAPAVSPTKASKKEG